MAARPVPAAGQEVLMADAGGDAVVVVAVGLHALLTSRSHRHSGTSEIWCNVNKNGFFAMDRKSFPKTRRKRYDCSCDESLILLLLSKQASRTGGKTAWCIKDHGLRKFCTLLTILLSAP